MPASENGATTPRRLAVKHFAKPAPHTSLELESFIGLFHEFIQEKRVDGLLIDVADYSHVPDGPGVILVGHDVEYALDRTGGRTGLRTLGKAFEEATLEEALRETLRKAVGCAQAIESDGRTGLSFDTSTVEIQLVDRLQAPKTPEAVQAALDEVEPAVRALFADAVIELVEASDRRLLPTLRVA
jgi:hypothetical protein